MAVYALIGIVITALAWLFDDGLLQNSEQESTIQHAIEAEPPEREGVVVGKTVDDLRSAYDVRPLRYEEQSMEISRLNGIYGVALARVLESNMSLDDELLDGITLQGELERYRGAVEIHKNIEGKVRIVGYVDEGSVARVVGTSKAVGSLYLYHQPIREGQVPISIPASRIIGWDYRSPHEFSEIGMD